MHRREVIYFTVGYVQRKSKILYRRICTEERREKIHFTVGYVQKRRNILYGRMCTEEKEYHEQ